MGPDLLDRYLLPEDRSIFDSPDRVSVYRVGSEKEADSPFGEIADHPIVRERELPPEEFGVATRAVRDAVESYRGLGAACFLPHHAVHFERAGRSLDFLLCFSCSNARIVGAGEKWIGLGIGTGGLDTLEDLLKTAEAPTAEKMPAKWLELQLGRIPIRMRRTVAHAEWAEIRKLSPAPSDVPLPALVAAAGKNPSPWPSMDRYPADRTRHLTGLQFVRLRRTLIDILQSPQVTRGLGFAPTHTLKFGKGTQWASFTLCPGSHTLEIRDSQGGHWQTTIGGYYPKALDYYVDPPSSS